MNKIDDADLVRTYYSDARHCFLNDSMADVFGSNIKIDGRNLTIMILSLNRVKLTIRLLRSIVEKVPGYRGKVLIADNGSVQEELDQLKRFLHDFPVEWQLLEFGENFGVAGGRNKAATAVTTDWVMSLDNDIYFISDPILQIEREIARLGCHFINVPLLNPDQKTVYAFGGSLQSIIQKGVPRLTFLPMLLLNNSIESVPALMKGSEGFLCTVLFGGASILNVHTFRSLGGFDDNMQVGFEDVDFSLRLFRAGIKVGSSSALSLVHDHPKMDNSFAADYEKVRYSRDLLRSSARYLEKKTGFVVWGDEVESWLIQIEKNQGLAASISDNSNRLESLVVRPRIALIADTDSWAFSNISRQIIKHLSEDFDFEFIPLVQLEDIERSRWIRSGRKGTFLEGGGSAFGQALMLCTDFDVVHVFWRQFLALIDSAFLRDYALSVGLTYPEFRRRYIEGKIFSTSVYDHLFLSDAEHEQQKRIFSEYVSGYTVSSKRLADIYSNIPGYPHPDAIIEDGVDLSIFSPRNLKRFDTVQDRALVVGWVGNSGWASTIEDFKGVHSILLPALKELQAEGVKLDICLADRQQRFIPHHKMPEYYAEIDLYICTSKIEGTPNPVLEAMACGVPVISTDVGIVPQVFGPLQSEFILAERSIQCLKNAIHRLAAEPQGLVNLSRENLDSIRKWDWELQAKKFRSYFSSLLEKKHLAEGEAKTKLCMLPFTTPSMEPSGSIRLCSASTIHAYYDETNMGNCRDPEGLKGVWTGAKYQRIRRSLFSGENLTPYCSACEYRFDGPIWMFQLHLSLYAYSVGVNTPEVWEVIRRWRFRYSEYQMLAQQAALAVLPLTEEEPSPTFELNRTNNSVRPKTVAAPDALITGIDLPVNIDLNTLNRCNVSCVMCPHAVRFDDQGAKKDPYFRLTVDMYNRVTEGIKVNAAHFVGAYAEPLLNKDIFELIAVAHGRGAFTAITSNGVALSKTFASKLIDAGLDMLSISLHGATKVVAEAVMRNSDFETVIKNIRNMQKLKMECNTVKPEIYFNYVGMKMNIQDFPLFIDLAADLGIRFINLFHLLDGDPVINKSQNLIYSPELLAMYVAEAKCKAKERGVMIFVSPAYEAVIADLKK